MTDKIKLRKLLSVTTVIDDNLHDLLSAIIDALPINSNTETKAVAQTVQKNQPQEKIAYFCEQWAGKYKARYTVLPKEAGLINRSFKGMGTDKFKSLVDAYLQMHDGYFLSKRHDITSLVMNVPKVSHFAQTGIKVTRHDVNHMELQDHNTNVFTRIAKETKNEN